MESSQVGAARRTAVRAADALGLSESRRGDVALIATELATNLVRHAQEGLVLIQTLGSPAGQCLELLAIDRGPGMVDPQKCLQDGYSTGGTAGTGLGAVRRLADEFDLESRREAGTVLLARVHAPGFDRRAAAFDVGAI
ncbi:MAG: ATP-binding protein [Acidobacteria bacterium]|nr:ATP-binding protein [Acidobacteriota bacterium]